MFTRLKRAWLRHAEPPVETLQRIRPAVEPLLSVTARVTDEPTPGEVNTNTREHPRAPRYEPNVATWPLRESDGSLVVVNLDAN